MNEVLQDTNTDAHDNNGRGMDELEHVEEEEFAAYLRQYEDMDRDNSTLFLEDGYTVER